jgi:hypothetical protein
MPQGSKADFPDAPSCFGFLELRRKRAGRHPKISVILAAVTNSQAIKVTKWSTFAGDLDVSEQQPDRISDNLGDVVGAGPTAPTDATPAEMAQEPTQAPVKQSMSVESPKIAPEQGEADKAKDAPKVEVTRAEVAKPEAAKAETPRVEAKAEAPKSPGQILIMPREQAWNGDNGEKTQSAGGGMFGMRRVAALAAVIALAVGAGAIGGALATAGFGRVAGDGAKVASSRALEDTISRLDTEVAALRTSLEQASKHSAAQIGKTTDRLDKVEKAQVEPSAKLAKLSETVEKLRTASVAAPAAAPVAAATATAPAAPKESTGSIQTANAGPAQVPLPAPKPEVARLPTVEGWVLRDAGNGSALIEGRQGIFEVYAGDPIPGLGRIDAIRKQDGRWVVVTSRGLIVGR